MNGARELIVGSEYTEREREKKGRSEKNGSSIKEKKMKIFV